MTLEQRLNLIPVPPKTLKTLFDNVLKQKHSEYLPVLQENGLISLDKPYRLTRLGEDIYQRTLNRIEIETQYKI